MKKWMGILVTIVCLLGMQMTVYADTRIDQVAVTFSYDKAPESGDEVGDIRATVSSSAPYFVEYAEYISDSVEWHVGDRPLVRVLLTAQSGYYFGYQSKSHFSLSGCSATYKSASRYDDNTSMELEVYLKRVGGVLGGANGLEWSGCTAVWEEMEGAKSYDVRLMRNGNTVTTVRTSGTYYNFAGNIQRAGDFTFKVRGISDYNDRAGEWSGASESYYVDEDDVRYISSSGRWVLDDIGWWYAYDNGGYPARTWKRIDNADYYFNSAGYMVTGWQRLDGEWYYMDPSGAKTTGWQFVNNYWYYMDRNGIMQTGWVYVDGKWYCLDQNGAMYANTITPDGRRVDASGARIY